MRNGGAGNTDSVWYDGVFVSKDNVFDYYTAIPLKWILHNNKGGTVSTLNGVDVISSNMGLAHGDSLYFSFSNKIPDTLSGKYNVFVVSDVFNTIFEYDKEDNNIIQGINPVDILSPDLKVDSVKAQDTISAGSNINISWKVKNKGSGKVGDIKWKDAVYLSTSPDSLKNQIFLGDVEYNVSLLSNGSTKQQKTVTLPVNVSGKWYIIISTDYTNTIFEAHIDNNNLGSSSLMQINITNWADLVPTNFAVSDTIKTSIAYNIVSTVSNNGNLYADGSWTDGIYISRLAAFDSTADLIGTVYHTGNVAAGSSYTNNVTLNVPFTSQLTNGKDSSWYFIYYKANDNNQLFENASTNNNILKTNSVFVCNPYVDHIVTTVSGYDTAVSGRLYNVQWSVENIGEKAGIGYYSSWFDGLYRSLDTVFDASDALLGQTAIYTPLDHNAAYSQDKTYQMPNGISGDYYLIERTDNGNVIGGEIDKNNNTNLIRDVNQKPKLIHFVSPPISDLEVTITSAPTTAIAGQPVTVAYTIKNNGTVDTYTNYWSDQLTLSSGYYPGNILLNNKNHSTGLKAGSSYTDTVQVYIPNDAAGNFVLVIQTDALNKVYDTIPNNNYAFSLLNISQLPPSDLIATNIIVPDSVLSGNTTTIKWQLNNIGINPAYGFLREAVYLSEDTILDNNDKLVGVIDADISIANNGFITDTVIANLNADAEGYNHVLVRTDLLNNINESNENNNVSVATKSIYISIKNLPLEVQTKDSVYNSNLLNYKIDIPASMQGATLQVSVTGDTLKGSTELYVSHGNIPSITNYDFADNNPYHKTKQVIVPSLDSGTYYLTIKGTENNAALQPVTLFAHILPFAITSVETNHGGNTGSVTVKIDGSKFDQGMAAKLKPAGSGNEITATNIIFESSTFIWATFNLNQQALGVYDLSLAKTDSSKAVLKNGFTIEKYNSGTFTINGTGMTGTGNAPGCDPGATGGSNESLQFTFDNPAQERTGRNIPVTILFANAGNVDITAPTLLLVSDVFPVSFENYFPNYNQKQLTIEFKETNGPPGILRAGATGAVIFYTRVIGPITNYYYLK